MTLAIGDGRQAVMASDFAMGQFRFLKRLLLVHGHANYQHLGYVVLYNFYHNAVFVLMLFWYIYGCPVACNCKLWSTAYQCQTSTQHQYDRLSNVSMLHSN